MFLAQSLASGFAHYTGSMRGSLALSAAGAALLVGGYFYAGMWPESQIFGRTLIAGDDPDEIALTYDDGPNDGHTERLLDILARHNAQATFFLIGRFARQRPDLVRRIQAAGHTIGNHTWTHPRLIFQPPARVREELSTTNSALEDILGERVRLLPPSLWSAAARRAAHRAGTRLGSSAVERHGI